MLPISLLAHLLLSEQVEKYSTGVDLLLDDGVGGVGADPLLVDGVGGHDLLSHNGT